MHCGRFHRPCTRREMLASCAGGFGGVALASIFAEQAAAESKSWQGLHHPARTKQVIFIYLDGGPSQIDTFDYKPLLEKHDGKSPHGLLKVEPTQFDNVGKVMASPWKFKRRGKAGNWVSDLLPHLAERADDLCFIKSMTSKFPEHTTANYFLHSGSGLQGRPSMGAWMSYGLGTLNRDLPAFVVLDGGLIPPGGIDNFGSGFLPAAHQGSVFRPVGQPVANVRPLENDSKRQVRKLELVRRLDGLAAAEAKRDDAIEAAIGNYETAFRMQTSVPDLVDLGKESVATKKLYGLDAKFPQTRSFAAECLLARRLIERGARFVELTCPSVGHDRWDQHGNLKDGHEKNCLVVDQPIAGLLADLKSRGLWDSTLVVWAGEFGRTPFAQGADGRDHNQYGFTVWLAGGGVKPGFVHGATDEWGYKAIENRVEMHDFHATLLHLLGVDHKRLTYRFGGRDMRLTDVHGEVIRDILA
ncbi:MAG TPA: DUF1501 domain-containing protein [Planctomycetia bacterium]|nr:DUF1501 domain-containing protein [Planctomycetia bacterium]